MTRRCGIALTVFGVIVIMAAGSVQAGMVGHISTVPIGTALNQGAVAGQGGEIESSVESEEGKASSEYQSRDPAETGELPESVEPRTDDANLSGNEEQPDRHDIDSGP